MMKCRLHIVLVLLMAALFGCTSKKSMPDMRESYARKDTKPFGTNIAHHMLKTFYPASVVKESRKSFSYTDQHMLKDSGSLYVSITRNFLIDEEDANSILDYVYNGNTFFLSGYNIDTVLLHKLFINIRYSFFDNLPVPFNYRNTGTGLIKEANVSLDSFRYFYVPFSTYFSEINDYYSRILGYNSNGKPNCIVFFWGKGKMILHCDPRAFSNYFLLTGKNHQYMQELFQLLDAEPTTIVWDDHYNKKNYKRSGSSFSSFSEIARHPPLAAAFLIMAVLLALYILFGGKRKQRIIPEIKPNLNSSVAFTETIARLYLQKKDNKNMADKMITYFNDFVRSHYFLQSPAGSDEFVQSLSRKSGVPLEKAVTLYRAFNHASQQTEIDDFELLSLNEQIQQFYKTRK